jgi:hypothetical protein
MPLVSANCSGGISIIGDASLCLDQIFAGKPHEDALLPEGMLFPILLSLVLSMTFSDNRFPLFRVML